MKYNFVVIILLMLPGCVISAEIDKSIKQDQTIQNKKTTEIKARNNENIKSDQNYSLISSNLDKPAIDSHSKPEPNNESLDKPAINSHSKSEPNNESLDKPAIDSHSKLEPNNESLNDSSKFSIEDTNSTIIEKLGSSYQSIIFTNTNNDKLPKIVINGNDEPKFFDAKTYLLMYTALLSTITFVITLSFRNEDKRSSIDDDFWIRDILTPKLHNSIDEYINSVRIIPDYISKNDIDEYVNLNVIPFRTKIVDCLSTISKTHKSLYKELYSSILELDDTYYDDNGDFQTADKAVREICIIWGEMNSKIYRYQISRREKPHRIIGSLKELFST